MKALQSVREKANSCRKIIGISKENLFARVQQYLWDKHRVELRPVTASSIRNSKAEVRPDQNCLLYDKELKQEPDKLLFYIIHELGHLECHQRLSQNCNNLDPVYGSIYSYAGTNSLTRYNPKSLEEVEANAFAAEFLCPSDDAFQLWRSNPNITLREIAEQFGSPLFIVRSQLANALYDVAFGRGVEEKNQSKKEINYNCKQIAASEKIGIPVLVDAGPGTGKTATLIRRIEFLLTKHPEDASNILVLTFSNEACSELYERVSSKFDESLASQIEISTFHGFGLSLIQKHGHRKDLDLNTCVVDEAGQRELLSEVIGDLYKSDESNSTKEKIKHLKILKVSKPDETAKEALRHITYLKERMITPDLLEEEINRMPSDESSLKEKAEDLLRIYKTYENLKNNRNKLDFADLIQMSVDILENNPDVLRINRAKYKWVLVDEYQDVSRATAILLKTLCNEGNPPWVVGDKRQSIFRFCGANPENIDEFKKDFPNAEEFTLNINYRSAEPLVKNKNKLANLIEGENDIEKEIWTADPDNPQSEINPIISLAIAESDEAERNGIVEQIESWMKQGIEKKDIAVLARRNVDVRNIVFALSKKGIPAVASGVVTAEGAAGDLANIITFADKPIPSIPRLVYCLGKYTYQKEDLDKLITFLIENFRKNKELLIDKDSVTEELSQEITKIYKGLNDEKFTSDAFSTICVFLFESSDYLRRLLDLSDKIEKNLALGEIAETLKRTLALNEIVTTLTQAATYRFSHQGIQSHTSRKDFAKYFRESLSQSTTPTTTPPSQLNADAIKVMTCHASKGLEFPYVIVAGQTLSEMGKRGEYKWLPQILTPNKEDDLEQSDSALFVGATRAKKGLAISYSKTSSGLPKARQRKSVPLLQKWSEFGDVSTNEWTSFELSEKDTFNEGKIWGGDLRYPIASRKLDKGECSLATYLQDALNLKFPLTEKPFYPAFYVAVRKVLRVIVTKTFEEQKQLTVQESLSILIAHWEFEEFRIDKDHIHHDLYWNLAQKYVQDFVNNFISEVGKPNFIDLIIESGGQEIELDLVCAYTINGSAKAIYFRPESLKDNLSKKNDSLLWGGIKDSHRNAFILLREKFSNLQIKVYSGTDGKIYDFQWGQERFIVGQETKMREKYENLVNEKFIGEVIENTCNYRCENRLNCPHWIGALK